MLDDVGRMLDIRGEYWLAAQFAGDKIFREMRFQGGTNVVVKKPVFEECRDPHFARRCAISGDHRQPCRPVHRRTLPSWIPPGGE